MGRARLVRVVEMRRLVVLLSCALQALHLCGGFCKAALLCRKLGSGSTTLV